MPFYPQTTATSPWPQSNYAPTIQYPTVASTTYPYQPMRPIGMSGRFVNSASEITPNEIAMDGSYSVFPMNDMSKIFVKSWNTDGTISTLEFVPAAKEKPEDKPEEDRIGIILEKISKIEEQLI